MGVGLSNEGWSRIHHPESVGKVLGKIMTEMID